MAGLLDTWGAMPEDQKGALMQGLLSAGFGAMSGRGTTLQALGQGGMAGLLGYNNAIEANQQRAQQAQMSDYRGAQAKKWKAEAEAEASKLAEEQALKSRRESFLGSFGAGGMTPGQAMAGGGGPTLDAAGKIGSPMQFDPFAALRAGFKPEEVEKMGAFGKTEVKDYREVRLPDGSVRIVGFDKFGGQVDTQQTPFKAPEIRSFGGYMGSIDPITGKVANVGSVTMSAAERAADTRARQGLSLQEQGLTLRRDEMAAGKLPAGYRWKGDGTLEAIPGGPASGAANITEGERNAGGYAERMVEATKLIDKFEPTGRSSLFTQLAGSLPFVGAAAQRGAMGPDQQRYRQAQEDWVRAKLRKESGAVIGKDEMDAEIATYFPMPGDTPEVIEQKQQSRGVANSAMTRTAGRGYQPQKGPQPGAVENGYRFKGGNASDPNAWEKL